MALSFNPQPFDILAGLVHWLGVVGISALVATVTFVVVSIMAVGWSGPWLIVEQLKETVTDFARLSPARCWALTVLTFREAFRRKTLMVFVVFAVLFLFAGWFMGDVTEDPEIQVKSYVAFVLRTISWLVLPVVMLLACWGLPEDIKARSLHTVVTKPVRKNEVVLGRVLGFAGIGALILAVTSIVGYLWITRQLTGESQAYLIARVPVYGSLAFVDREGSEADRGINTGDEYLFRSFIEGNTKARAIWDFENIRVPPGAGRGSLILESSFQAFRTHKGTIEKELLGKMTLVNAARNLRVPLTVFPVHEFRRNVYDVVAEMGGRLEDETGTPVDIEKDLLADGRLRVEVECLSSGQFLGMARPDLFVRLAERSFASSFFKSVFGIALMMTMVIVLGVMAGCFLKGPVATLLTGFVVIVGCLAHGFLQTLTSGRYKDAPQFEVKGRGMLESLVNIPTHRNPLAGMEDTFVNRIIIAIDRFILNILWALQHWFPDLSAFDTTEYAANGLDVPWSEALLPSIATTIGFCIPWVLVGYMSLKMRELEAK